MGGGEGLAVVMGGEGLAVVMAGGMIWFRCGAKGEELWGYSS